VRHPPRQAARPGPIGNAGSFFKNPVVSAEQCRDIIGRDPHIVHYPLADGRFKLAAGWLIDACGWKGKSVGRAGVYERQALVLVNRGGATGAEVMTLARAIQESVYGRFGIRLEPDRWPGCAPGRSWGSAWSCAPPSWRACCRPRRWRCAGRGTCGRTRRPGRSASIRRRPSPARRSSRRWHRACWGPSDGWVRPPAPGPGC
jgi:hypothetical protein